MPYQDRLLVSVEQQKFVEFKPHPRDTLLDDPALRR